MTGAVGLFPWNFGCRPNVQETKTASAEQIRKKKNAGETGCPTALDLIELHNHWFGGDSEIAETASTHSGAKATAPSGRNAPAREQTPVIYRITRSDQTTIADTGSRAETHASRDETIAVTLARAEQFLQQTSELPQHSRLQASLSALEAALAGTDLSDLESALSEQDVPRKQTASS